MTYPISVRTSGQKLLTPPRLSQASETPAVRDAYSPASLPPVSPVRPSSVTASRAGGFVPVEADGYLQTQAGIRLKIGPIAPLTPQLLLSHDTLTDIVSRLAGPDTLIVTDGFNYPLLKHLGPCIAVEKGTPEQVDKVRNLPDFSRYQRIVGVGGCLALDIAKAAAVDGQHLKVIPTLLSTNCITKNRSVIGDGLDAFSYRTGTPEEVIVPIDDIVQQPAAVRSHWSQSGFGDFFSKLSAMIEQLGAKGQPATLQTMRGIDPEVVDGLQWVQDSFHGYNRPELTRLAELAHDAGVKVLSCPNNDISIGGEHKFYKAMMDLYPHLRYGPTHGQIVAIGTLVAAKAYAEQTGSSDLYHQVRAAFDKLEIPTHYSTLAKLGIDKEVLAKTLARIAAPDIKSSYLGDYFKTHDTTLLDRTFADDQGVAGKPARR